VTVRRCSSVVFGTVSETANPTTLAIEMTVWRGDRPAWHSETSTALIRRRFADLITHLYCQLSFPHGVILSTSTGLVPDLSFTLLPGDEVTNRHQGHRSAVQSDAVGRAGNRDCADRAMKRFADDWIQIRTGYLEERGLPLQRDRRRARRRAARQRRRCDARHVDRPRVDPTPVFGSPTSRSSSTATRTRTMCAATVAPARSPIRSSPRLPSRPLGWRTTTGSSASYRSRIRTRTALTTATRRTSPCCWGIASASTGCCATATGSISGSPRTPS
jgi:hypothetical protein